MRLNNIDYTSCVEIGVNTVDSEFNTDTLRLVSDVIILNLVNGGTETKSFSDCLDKGWYIFVDLNTRNIYISNLKNYNFKYGKLYNYSYDGIDIVYIDGDNGGIENCLITDYNCNYNVWCNLKNWDTNILFDGLDLITGKRLTIDKIENNLTVYSDYTDELVGSLSSRLNGFKAFGNALILDSLDTSSPTLVVPNGYKYIIFDTYISKDITSLVIPPAVELVIDVHKILDLEKIYLPKGTKLGDIFYLYPRRFPKKVEIIEY